MGQEVKAWLQAMPAICATWWQERGCDGSGHILTGGDEVQGYTMPCDGCERCNAPEQVSGEAGRLLRFLDHLTSNRDTLFVGSGLTPLGAEQRKKLVSAFLNLEHGSMDAPAYSRAEPKPGLVPAPVEWNRDPAASGWRSRAFLDFGELIVYDSGQWEIRRPEHSYGNCQGEEATAELAKKRALAVYTALTKKIAT